MEQSLACSLETLGITTRFSKRHMYKIYIDYVVYGYHLDSNPGPVFIFAEILEE